MNSNWMGNEEPHFLHPHKISIHVPLILSDPLPPHRRKPTQAVFRRSICDNNGRLCIEDRREKGPGFR